MGTTLIRGGALFVVGQLIQIWIITSSAIGPLCTHLEPIGMVNYKDWEFFRSHDPRNPSKLGK